MRDGLVELRRRLRAARRAVGERERAAAARAIAARLAALGLPRPRTRIAAYEASDGELDPSHALARAVALGCTIHFPRITSLRGRRMRFLPAGAGPAARPSSPDPARWFDLVLVPLVAFDALGNRLGRGAGFYDRHFAFLLRRRAWRRPLLLGVAFEFQRVDRLPAKPSDVPLWGVVTERGVYGRAAGRLRDLP